MRIPSYHLSTPKGNYLALLDAGQTLTFYNEYLARMMLKKILKKVSTPIILHHLPPYKPDYKGDVEPYSRYFIYRAELREIPRERN